MQAYEKLIYASIKTVESFNSLDSNDNLNPQKELVTFSNLIPDTILLHDSYFHFNGKTLLGGMITIQKSFSLLMIVI